MNQDEQNRVPEEQNPGEKSAPPAAEPLVTNRRKRGTKTAEKRQDPERSGTDGGEPAAPAAESGTPVKRRRKPAAKKTAAEKAPAGPDAAADQPADAAPQEKAPPKKRRKTTAKKPKTTTEELLKMVDQLSHTGELSAAPQQTAEEEPSAAAKEAAGEETSADGAQQPDPAGEVPPAAPQETDGEEARQETEREEAERRRVADMTRTVQVSIEQILAMAAEQEAIQAAGQEEPAGPEPTGPVPPAAPDHEEETTVTLTETLGRGAVSFGKWVLLVCCFVLLIAGAGVAWLWNGATEDALPLITVTLDGEELPAAAYSWKVPVIGNSLKRTYAETLRTSPYQLSADVESTQPLITVTPEDMTSELTVKAEGGDTVFQGTLREFTRAALPGNGSYEARLVLREAEDVFEQGGTVSGSQTYQFAFTVDVRPSLRLNTRSIQQGSVAALIVTNLEEGDVPVLYTDLENCGFVQSSRGWVCYLPIASDTKPGDYTLRVVTAAYDQQITLNVRSTSFPYKDYSRASQLMTPYLSGEETPAQVQAVLDTVDPEIHWAGSGFVQPLASVSSVKLSYGTIEYVGRTSAQKASGAGEGRSAGGTILTTRRGDTVYAPAAGRVLLAGDLGGDAGNTVVVEHGAGLKSIFYGLDDLAVKTGDSVVQWQSLGTAGKTMVLEARIGTVSVDAFAIWRGRCDAVKTY